MENISPLSTLKDITFHLIYFVFWWYIKQTAFWFKFVYRTILLLADGASLVPMVKNLFAPYHQDYTLVGRLIGFVTRFIWIVFSVAILIVAFALLITIPLIWWILPLAFYFGFSFSSFFDQRVFSFLGVVISFFCVYLYWRYYIIQPKKTVYDIGENEISLENLAETFMPNLKRAFNHAYELAYEDKNLNDLPYYLFVSLVKEKRNRAIFWRLNISSRAILERAQSKKDQLLKTIAPLPELLKLFWQKAQEMGHYHLDTDAVLVALVENIEPIQKIFIDLEIRKEDIDRTAEWIYARILAAHRWKYWRRKDFHLYGGYDQAWTSGWIPTLKHYSQNITALVARGMVPYTVGRKKEIEEIVRVLSRTTKNNVILLGPAGVGKTSIIYGIAQRILAGNLEEIKDKKVVSLDLAAMLAGASNRGDFEERLQVSLRESGSGKTILFIDEIQNIMGAGTTGQSLLDASAILEPILSSGGLQCIGATTHKDFRQYIEPNEAFTSHFQTVEILEPSDDEATFILENLASVIEARQGVMIIYQAIENAVKLSRQFIRDRVLPEKAIDILDEAAVTARRTKDKKVTAEIVAEIISQKTGIPVSKLTVEESAKLLHLEDEIHRRLINQEEAVSAIANAMRRARAGLKEAKRPIASFLFLGPTGVGKTETAKALSDIYYGSEENMVRLDMTEYQAPDSVTKLIGASPGHLGFGSGGQLTEAVRSRPFSLVLLDEFEKAASDILNIFLQVFDDGRLTDSSGRTVLFYDTIIIATSNAQSVMIQEAVRKGLAQEKIKDLVMQDLNQHFRPELLNRFDAVIIFKPLNMDHVIEITHLLLKKLSDKLQAKEIAFEISPQAVLKLARMGFDPQFGARPLKRVIQEKLENPLAQRLLQKAIRPGQVVQINEQDILE